MTAIHEAAERLRTAGSKRGLHRVYIGSEHIYEQDMETIANAYLAERDPTPLDEAWLRSVGFTFGHKWKNGFGYCELPAGSDTITVSCPDGKEWGEEEWAVGGERIPHSLMPATRGDLRLLCKALGIELEGE